MTWWRWGRRGGKGERAPTHVTPIMHRVVNTTYTFCKLVRENIQADIAIENNACFERTPIFDEEVRVDFAQWVTNPSNTQSQILLY